MNLDTIQHQEGAAVIEIDHLTDPILIVTTYTHVIKIRSFRKHTGFLSTKDFEHDTQNSSKVDSGGRHIGKLVKYM